MKIILALIYLTLLCVTLYPQTAIMPAGDGSTDNPYLISCWENLYWMSIREDIDMISYPEKMNAHYLQTSDIVFPIEINAWDNNQGWMPIGYHHNNNNIDYPFQGTYNGQLYSITHLYIYRPGSHLIGLFGLVSGLTETPAILKNIRLIEIDIRGSYYCGSLAGKITNTQIINCSAGGFLQGFFNSAGLIGTADYSKITDSYSTCLVNCTYVRGGLVSELNKSMLINSYYDYESVLINNEHLIYPGALSQSMFADWLSHQGELHPEDYFQSEENNVFLISSTEEFKKILGFYWQPNYTFSIQNDIDLSEDPNFYIPYFNGKIIGNFHHISHFSYIYPLNDYAYRIGLIGQAYQAEISELILSNFNVTGSYNIGSFCGYADSSHFSDIHSEANSTGDFYTGGLVGTLENSSLNRCSHQGFVVGYNYAGGLIGTTDHSQVYDSYSLGTVNTQVYYSAGISGKSNNSLFQRCYTSTETHSFDRAGGFIGESSDSEFIGCFWNTDQGDATTAISQSINNNDIELIGIETASMQNISTFTDYDWNFNSVWNITASMNYSLPYLRGETPLSNDIFDNITIINNQEDIFVYPNPVRGIAMIKLHSSHSRSGNITVYNIKGQKVKDISNQLGTYEKQSIQLDSNDLACGVYFIVYRNEHTIKSKKILVIK